MSTKSRMRHRLENAIGAYIEAFEKKHGCEFQFAVCDEYMGAICMSDEFFTAEDIVYDIDHGLPKGMIYQWYQANLEHEGTQPSINLIQWSNGVRYETKEKNNDTQTSNSNT